MHASFRSAIAFALIAAHGVSAQEAPKSDPPKDDAPKNETPAAPQKAPPSRPAGAKPEPKSETIEVTGRRTANSERRDATAAKIVIGREDIEQYGDSNLGDVLRRLPGVSSGGRPGRPGAPMMRGMGGGFTQILINGERIPPGFSVEQITPEQVERIEILRAPTAETGARAIAGTINIILREPLRKLSNDLRGGVQWERGKASPSAAWTHNDAFGANGNYNITLSHNIFDQLTDTATRTLFADLAGGATALSQESFSQSHDKRTGTFFSSRFQWRLGPGEQFSFQPFLVDHRFETRSRGTLTQTVGTAPAPYATSAGTTDLDFNVARFMSMLNKRLGDDWRAEARLSGGRFSSRSRGTVDEFLADGSRALNQTNDTRTKDRSFNVAGKLARPWGDGKHNLAFGGEIERVQRTENPLTVLNGVTQLADFGSEVNVSTDRRAFYLQDDWDPSPQFAGYLGVRWEGIETKSALQTAPVRNRSSVVSPLAHAVWRFAAPARDQIRLSLTQSYRAPSTQQLVARPTLNTLYAVPGGNVSTSPDRAGNANLKPEIAHGIDLAYENYLKAGGVVSANFFRRNISDLIRSVTTLETVSWAPVPRYVSRPQNVGDAVTMGLELDAKFSLPEVIDGAPPLNVKANLSLYRSRVEDVMGPNNRIDQQPRASGNFGVDYRLRGTPLTWGGTVSWTPAYETQTTNTQLNKVNTKRVIETYALYNLTPTARIRFTLANVSPLDVVNTVVNLTDTQRQTIVTNGRTAMSAAIRFELKL